MSANKGWIQTQSGGKVFPLDMRPGDVFLSDIAHALSNICRFGGHSDSFYSVAQHSVYVSHLCDPEDAKWGLLHDASEAYLGDVLSPLKRLPEYAFYKEAEKRCMNAICDRFALPHQEPASVKKADMIMLETEARNLHSPLHPDWKPTSVPADFIVDPLPPRQARDLFYERYFELFQS